MSDVTIIHTDAIPFYEGPHSIPGIRFRGARAALGVSAWGMNILDLDPGCDGHPEHDHSHDGQEEVYVVLSGSAELHVDGAAHPLVAGSLVRVGPALTRRLIAGPDGARLLAIGATPGEVFTASVGM